MHDKELVCGCGNTFIFTERDQEFYQVKGYTPPKRCMDCRTKKKAKYAEREAKEISDRIMSGEKVNLN